ncbi:MAG: glycosyltransferase family 2 protein [Opitutaceae bacterium]|nr:glycosyltransferase family 2 protein [Cytophagales bacterium]
MIFSVVSPVYNGEGILFELVNRIKSSLANFEGQYEIILVDDGSIDNSWNEIESIALGSSQIVAIKLTRNYGQNLAIRAGVDISAGDFILVMDCDLQDNPEYINLLYQKTQEGFDIVFTKRIKQKHNVVKKALSSVYYLLSSYLISGLFSERYGSMVIFNRKVANCYMLVNDHNSHYLQILNWIGFRKTHVFIEHAERFKGQSSYTLNKLIILGLNSIIAHSNRLLKFSVYSGFLLLSISFYYLFINIFSRDLENTKSNHFMLMAGIFFSSGIILLNMGIIGLYIGRTFNQTKNMPLYFVETQLNSTD